MNTYIFEEYDNDILKIFIRLNFSKYKNINFFTPFNISNAEYYIKKLKFKLVVHYGVKLQI